MIINQLSGSEAESHCPRFHAIHLIHSVLEQLSFPGHCSQDDFSIKR